MRLPTHYLAMYGQKTERITIGKYPDAETAKTACEEYRQKNASTGQSVLAKLAVMPAEGQANADYVIWFGAWIRG